MPTRRSLLAAALATTFTHTFLRADPVQSKKSKAAVIGHTTRGDYGHGLDTIFNNHPDIQITALADPDEQGRAQAQKRTGAVSTYADYREMLDKDKPHLVSVAPRTTGERKEMLLAALASGAHVISEKPFCRAPADGDEALKLAADKHKRIAVAHQMHIAPPVLHLKKRIQDGLIGDLLHMNAFGKQDRRAGGEDMVVLGTHLFDLMRLFAGNPQSASAVILQTGRPATIADARNPTEDIGPILGDEITAQFTFKNAVTATFTSRAKLRDITGHWGLELIGSKAVARILADIWPRVMLRPPGKWEQESRTDTWRPLEDDPSLKFPADAKSSTAQNARVRDDWLAAITESRDPACSAHNAAAAVEMVHAVWQAGLTGARIPFPLRQRQHALTP